MTAFGIDTNLREAWGKPFDCRRVDAYLAKRGRGGLSGIGCAVRAASEKYGINPWYIVAHAALETGWGASRISREKNNLFGWSAFDSSPYSSARAFPSRAACIDFVMGRIDDLYLSPSGKWFRGAVLGDRTHGMNANYATDPEWGRKIAAIVRRLEREV